ncbi:MAG: hypothetical protein ACK559_11840, partial [bacterium]
MAAVVGAAVPVGPHAASEAVGRRAAGDQRAARGGAKVVTRGRAVVGKPHQQRVFGGVVPGVGAVAQEPDRARPRAEGRCPAHLSPAARLGV